MGNTRFASVLGLGFGDCGKGHFVDVLTRRWRAHTVARFSGGAQAGHNVVVPGRQGKSSRQHHTFSQFGSGTWVPGTRTVLLDPMVIHPTALLVEAAVLAGKGVDDALLRLRIDSKCRVTTPYHQAAGRLRERLRGASAHGTCGVGVGETVRHNLAHPSETLRYSDLCPVSAKPRVALEKLHAIRETLAAEFHPQCPAGSPGAETEEFETLMDETLAQRWLSIARAMARQVPPAPEEEIRRVLSEPGCVIMEGAQGILLDEWRGFHPHTTWSSITTQAVEDSLARFGIHAEVEHYGVLRSYLTRHGNGPFPTHDPALDEVLPEPHNASDGWQGVFRRGHPDAVLLRYALASVGRLSGVMLGHLDVFQRGIPLRWCERYSAGSPIDQLPLGKCGDLGHQEMLAGLLQQARPVYAQGVLKSEGEWMERFAGVAGLPVVLHSYGETFEDVKSD